MITIQNLEVRFEVEGSEDEAVFARLFARHMKLWRRQEQEQQARRELAERGRALGDRPAAGGTR